MSAPTTEIVILPLPSGMSIEDAATSAGQTFAQMRKVVSSQPGFQRQYWGRQLENPDHLVLAIDWDEIGSHHRFMQSPVYPEVIGQVSTLLDDPSTPLNPIHVNCIPHSPDDPRSSPVTETVFFALNKSASSAQKSELEKAVLHLAHTCCTQSSLAAAEEEEREGKEEGRDGKEDPRATSSATGWVFEDLDLDPDRYTTSSDTDTDKDSDSGKVIRFMLMLGWQSKEAHLKAKRTPAFTSAIQPIRSMVLSPPPGQSSMYHVSFHESMQ